MVRKKVDLRLTFPFRRLKMDLGLGTLILCLLSCHITSGQIMDKNCFTDVDTVLKEQLAIINSFLCRFATKSDKLLVLPVFLNIYSSFVTNTELTNFAADGCSFIQAIHGVTDSEPEGVLKAQAVLKSNLFATKRAKALSCSFKYSDKSKIHKSQRLLELYPDFLAKLDGAVRKVLKIKKQQDQDTKVSSNRQSPECFAENQRPVLWPGDRVVLKMTCTSPTKIQSTQWSSVCEKGTENIDLQSATEDQYMDELPNHEYKMVLVIAKGVLVGGNKYKFVATATNAIGKQTETAVSLKVLTGIKGGTMKCPSSYTEHEKIKVSVTGVTGPETMTYTLLVQKSPGKFQTLSEKEATGQFNILGPKRYGNEGNDFHAEVCSLATPHRCITLTCSVPRVHSRLPEEYHLNSIRGNVTKLWKNGQALKAAVLLGTFLDRRTDTSLISLMLDIASDIVQKGIFDISKATTFLDVMTSIPPDHLTSSQLLQFVHYIKSASDVFVKHDVKIPARYIASLDSWMTVADGLGLSDLDIKSLASQTDLLQSCGMKSGDKQTFNLTNSHVTLLHNVPGDNVLAKDKNQNTIRLRFGGCLREKVGHNNMKIRVDAYKGRPKSITDIHTVHVAPIIAVSFWNPHTNTEQKIENLKTHATIQLTLDKAHQYGPGALRCVYWNPSHRKWMSDGVTTGIQTGSTIECKTSHFSTYTVIHAYQDYNKDQNVGWIVGVVLGVIIAMIVIILLIICLFYRCKGYNQVDDSSRSNSPLRGREDSYENKDNRRQAANKNQGQVNEGGNWRQDVYHMEIRPGSGDGLKRALP